MIIIDITYTNTIKYMIQLLEYQFITYKNHNIGPTVTVVCTLLTTACVTSLEQWLLFKVLTLTFIMI
jgi:hypothetical protein